MCHLVGLILIVLRLCSAITYRISNINRLKTINENGEHTIREKNSEYELLFNKNTGANKKETEIESNTKQDMPSKMESENKGSSTYAPLFLNSKKGFSDIQKNHVNDIKEVPVPGPSSEPFKIENRKCVHGDGLRSNVIIIDSGYSSNKLNIFSFQNRKLKRTIVKFYPSLLGKNLPEIQKIMKYILEDARNILLDYETREIDDKMVFLNTFEDIPCQNIPYTPDCYETKTKKFGPLGFLSSKANKYSKTSDMDQITLLKNTKLAFIGTEGLRSLLEIPQTAENQNINWSQLVDLLNNMFTESDFTVYKPTILSGVNEGLYAFESLIYLNSLEPNQSENDKGVYESNGTSSLINKKLVGPDELLDFNDTTEFTNELFVELTQGTIEKTFIYPISSRINAHDTQKDIIHLNNETNPSISNQSIQSHPIDDAYFKPSTGIIEMGGGSLQITFSIVNNEYPIVISRSFDNLGMQKGRKLFIKHFGLHSILSKDILKEYESDNILRDTISEEAQNADQNIKNKSHILKPANTNLDETENKDKPNGNISHIQYSSNTNSKKAQSPGQNIKNTGFTSKVTDITSYEPHKTEQDMGKNKDSDNFAERSPDNGDTTSLEIINTDESRPKNRIKEQSQNKNDMRDIPEHSGIKNKNHNETDKYDRGLSVSNSYNIDHTKNSDSPKEKTDAIDGNAIQQASVQQTSVNESSKKKNDKEQPADFLPVETPLNKTLDCTDFNDVCITQFRQLFQLVLFTISAPVYLVDNFYLLSFYYDVLNKYENIHQLHDIVEVYNQVCIRNKNNKPEKDQYNIDHCLDLSYIIFTLKALNVSDLTRLDVLRSVNGFNFTWGVAKAWEINNE